MKYLNEYRDPELAKSYLDAIAATVTRPWTIMEVCGGQTHSLVRNGILALLPDKVRMVHGPGCPVCVTPQNLIDQAVSLANRPEVILCSYGDMLRVPGTQSSLLEAKANGGDVRILYSPLEAVRVAQDNPGKEVVFFAVGFETTAPAHALAVLQAQKMGVTNFSLLASHVLVPPAIEAVMDDPETQIQAFLAAGHVCTIMGTAEYHPLTEKYNIPIVVTGFEPIDLLQGILMVVRQLEAGNHALENQYSRMVKPEGNPAAAGAMLAVFETRDQEWRGIGTIPNSGLGMRGAFSAWDAARKFGLSLPTDTACTVCQAGRIMKGLMRPNECPSFGTTCTPSHPIGAPMVSSEGACAAYYNYSFV